MKFTIAAASLFFLFGCTSVQTIKQKTKTVPTYEAKEFFKTVNYFGAKFSPDESKLLITNNKDGVFNAYSIPFNGGKQKKLTDSKKSMVRGVSYFPNDNRILYSSDNEGDELNHLYVMINGKSKDLTPGKKTKASFMGWKDSKDAFFVMTNGRDPKFFDIYEYSTKDYKRKLIFKNTLGVFPGSISRDGKWLSVSKVNNNVDSDILLVNLADKKDTKPFLITKHKGMANFESQDFTPDGKKLIYTTDSQGEFFEAWSYDLETKEHKPYLKEDWDIIYLYFSEKGNYRITGVNADARTKVTLYDLNKKKNVKLPKINGNVTGVRLSPSETKLAFYVERDTSPSNLYTMKLSDSKPRKITESLNSNINENHLVQGHVIRYESFDGVEVPSILYKPWSASAENKVPALVFVHGGPGGQSRKGYRDIVQHLVNHGYAVLMVNNRGSSGYGKTFYHLDDKKHGEDDLKDCIWGRKYLSELDWVDKNKVAIMGGSYGGYMVAAALAFTPEAFEAGINIFGVTNWIRTLKSIPPYWEAQRTYLYSEIGDPVKEEAFLRAKSPLFHADKIKKPLMVVQGANDPRVIKPESDDIVKALKKNSVPVDYLLFEDEGHGFTKTKNRIKASEEYVRFLKTHL